MLRGTADGNGSRRVRIGLAFVSAAAANPLCCRAGLGRPSPAGKYTANPLILPPPGGTFTYSGVFNGAEGEGQTTQVTDVAQDMVPTMGSGSETATVLLTTLPPMTIVQLAPIPPIAPVATGQRAAALAKCKKKKSKKAKKKCRKRPWRCPSDVAGQPAGTAVTSSPLRSATSAARPRPMRIP